MTQTEALRLALEALEAIIHWYGVRDKNDVMMPPLNQNPEIKESMDAITAIKAALEAKDEPVAWMVYTQEGQSAFVTDNPAVIHPSQRALPLYATPQRTWVGLTDAEVDQAFTELTLRKIYQAIEAKLKEKNNG